MYTGVPEETYDPDNADTPADDCGIALLAENTGSFTVTGGTYGSDYTYEDGVLTVLGGNITISGTTTTDRIVVTGTANITLSGVSITSGSAAAFDITGGGTVTVTLAGNNTLKSGTNYAGLQKNGDSCKLIINGSGSLNATGGTGGAGIGGGRNSNSSNITIDGGNITAASTNGAGIGGGFMGNGSNIIINGGTINANSTSGAGIGGGSGCNGSIIINGGTIENANSSGGGAGIGGGSGGSGSITITNCEEINASGNVGGAGIGGGSNSNGTIKITGGSNITASSEKGGAGIGGGSGSNVKSTIEISGGDNITATGGINPGAGIGSGAYGSGDADITISGGKNITATGGINGGAGIGSGGSNSGSTKVTISGGEVTAVGAGSIAIGSNGSGKTTIEISGEDTVVTAEGKNHVYPNGYAVSGECISAKNNSESSIEINGGTVTAKVTEGNASGINVANVTIDGENTVVEATGSGTGDGITGSTIKINNGTVTAEGGKDGGTGISGSDIDIKGAGSTSYPWVYTNGITDTSGSGYLAIVLDLDGKNAAVYGGEVVLNDEYLFNTGGTLTVKSGATFATNGKLKLENGSTLYLEKNAKLDKWYKIEKDAGSKILHKDNSDYQWYDLETDEFIEELYDKLYILNDKEGIVLCDICGKPEPHGLVSNSDWERNETHHWHDDECSLGNNCAEEPSQIEECSYIAGGKLDYGIHIYGDPVDKNDGKLYYYCKACDYERAADKPIVTEPTPTPAEPTETASPTETTAADVTTVPDVTTASEATTVPDVTTVSSGGGNRPSPSYYPTVTTTVTAPRTETEHYQNDYTGENISVEAGYYEADNDGINVIPPIILIVITAASAFVLYRREKK